MIRHIYKIMIAIVCCLLAIPTEAQTKAEKNGWRLGMQSYSFHLFPRCTNSERDQGTCGIQRYQDRRNRGVCRRKVIRLGKDVQVRKSDGPRIHYLRTGFK